MNSFLFKCIGLGALALLLPLRAQDSPTVHDSSVLAPPLQKPAFVFSVDQGFGNSPIPEGDTVGLQRVADAIKAFTPRYEVYALLNCGLADTARMQAALDIFARAGIPFVFDVYASDTVTNTRNEPIPVLKPYDMRHGRGLSVAQLADWKRRYGRFFAGLRVFEVFSMNYTILSGQKNGKTWDRNFRMNEPADRFYQRQFLEDYIRFAHAHGMFLLFGDWLWSAHANSAFLRDVVHEPQNEADLKALCATYPGTVVVMYDNNEPNGGSLPRLSSWNKIFQPFVAAGAKGFGLSDQSWLYTGVLKDPFSELKTPVADLDHWAHSTFDRGGLVVQLEPFWYWFKFPKPHSGHAVVTYLQTPAWADRGEPSENLRTFAASFGITLPPDSKPDPHP